IPRAFCIAHLHIPAVIAVGAQKPGLLPLSQNALFFTDKIAYHEYDGLTPWITKHQRESFAKSLGTKRAMILRNHGLLVWGESIPIVWGNVYGLARACEIQVLAQNLPSGSKLHPARRR